MVSRGQRSSIPDGPFGAADRGPKRSETTIGLSGARFSSRATITIALAPICQDPARGPDRHPARRPARRPGSPPSSPTGSPASSSRAQALPQLPARFAAGLSAGAAAHSDSRPRAATGWPARPRSHTPREYSDSDAPAPCEAARPGAILREPPTPGRSRAPPNPPEGPVERPTDRPRIAASVAPSLAPPPPVQQAAAPAISVIRAAGSHRQYGREARMASRPR